MSKHICSLNCYLHDSHASPALSFGFFPPHHVFLASCWSVIPCQQTHLTLHQNVSHIPDLPLQTQRNVVSKTLASARSAPSDTPACDLIFWRPLRDGMGCFLSPNEAASFASWFHYRRHSSSICIFHERVSPPRKSLWSFCCVCILFIYWCDVSGAYYS